MRQRIAAGHQVRRLHHRLGCCCCRRGGGLSVHRQAQEGAAIIQRRHTAPAHHPRNARLPGALHCAAVASVCVVVCVSLWLCPPDPSSLRLATLATTILRCAPCTHKHAPPHGSPCAQVRPHAINCTCINVVCCSIHTDIVVLSRRVSCSPPTAALLGGFNTLLRLITELPAQRQVTPNCGCVAMGYLQEKHAPAVVGSIIARTHSLPCVLAAIVCQIRRYLAFRDLIHVMHVAC